MATSRLGAFVNYMCFIVRSNKPCLFHSFKLASFPPVLHYQEPLGGFDRLLFADTLGRCPEISGCLLGPRRVRRVGSAGGTELLQGLMSVH